MWLGHLMAIFAPPENCGLLTLATMACARGKGLTSAGTFAARFRHRNQIERAVQLRFRQHLFLPANFAHGFSSFRTFLGDLRGPLASQRMSLAILNKLTAIVLSWPLASTTASFPPCASK